IGNWNLSQPKIPVQKFEIRNRVISFQTKGKFQNRHHNFLDKLSRKNLFVLTVLQQLNCS
ncbi:MAG: hypothetical protein VSS75_030280, partial [Candidatus Parabeggiatoa sp.]|nr:hypothetical protein [Candidatus Parabeggiatoa sp.]